ncbi:hypothetical protein ACHAWF_012153 [Thalassiosira exigua]
MTCPPHLITNLFIDDDGWIRARNEGESQGDGGHPIVTRSCHRLLKEAKLDQSVVFPCGRSRSTNSETSKPVDPPLDEIVHRPNLPKVILKVISDIRRLDAPKEGREEKKTKRGRHGKVKRLEEQRKLRQNQEQQKSERNQRNDDGSEENEGEQGRDPGDDEDFVFVGQSDDPVDETTTPVELRLAAVFNTLRILVALVRPMADHPRSKDLELKMKNGPSIQSKGKNHRCYLISRRVYSCTSVGYRREIIKEYRKLLDEMQAGMSEDMSKLGSDGDYELDVKDWIASLFNHELYQNQELLAKKCIGLSDPNPEASSKLCDALIDRFESQHDVEKQYKLQRAIDRLHDKLMYAISRKFNGVKLTVYGSCLSGLALKGSHDVDVSVMVPELHFMKVKFDMGQVSADAYEKRMRKIIFCVRDCLEFCRRSSFADLFAIARARVPVVKGTDTDAGNPYTKDGSLSFDLCFLNDIAVVNSSLLRQYSLFDSRVRILMLSVKSFAKAKNIASAADGTLSSYSWLNMVVFYLQCVGFLPVLQCPKMMEDHGFKPDPSGNRWHCVNGLQTCYLTRDLVVEKGIWDMPAYVNNANMAHLLYGFFHFYSDVFPRHTVAASCRFGKIQLQKTSLHQTSKVWRMCLEDPFETCDSHCPHDLGCHVNEDGQKRINELLMLARKDLGMILQIQKEMASDDIIGEFVRKLLCPESNEKEEQAPVAAVAPQLERHHSNNAPHRGQRRGGNGANRSRRNVDAKDKRGTYQQKQNTFSKETKRENQIIGSKAGRINKGKGVGVDGKRGGQPVYMHMEEHGQRVRHNNKPNKNTAKYAQSIQQSLQHDETFISEQKKKLDQISSEKKSHPKPEKKSRRRPPKPKKDGAHDIKKADNNDNTRNGDRPQATHENQQ